MCILSLRDGWKQPTDLSVGQYVRIISPIGTADCLTLSTVTVKQNVVATRSGNELPGYHQISRRSQSARAKTRT